MQLDQILMQLMKSGMSSSRYVPPTLPLSLSTQYGTDERRRQVKGVPDTTYVNSKTHGMAGGYEPIFEDEGEVVRWESCRKVRGEQK
jgi:hypothetical protein